MPSEHIHQHIQDRILTLEINRRDRKNALNQSAYIALIEGLDEAENNPDISVVMIQGQSDLFSSGNDIKDFLNREPNQEPKGRVFLKRIANFTKPIIAAVAGDAIGIGSTLLLHCDFVLAANNARFQLSFVNLGLCPEGGSSYLLPLMAGSKLASELLLNGKPFDAEIAKNAGIVTSIWSPEEVIDRARDLAQEIAEKPLDALLTTKALIKKPIQAQLNQVIDEELKEFSRLLNTAPSKEIMSAFLEKRMPDKSTFKIITK
jgi:enoyl-CoA hydratase/carnithine racemase